MLSFTSSLSPDCEAFAIFVTDKYDYKDKKDILSNNEVKKINSFLDVLKVKKKDEELSFWTKHLFYPYIHTSRSQILQTPRYYHLNYL